MKIRAESPLVRVGAALLSTLLITSGLHFVRLPGASAPDFPCTSGNGTNTTVSISSGETGSSIAESLFSEGVVKSVESYFRVAVNNLSSLQNTLF